MPDKTGTLQSMTYYQLRHYLGKLGFRFGPRV